MLRARMSRRSARGEDQQLPRERREHGPGRHGTLDLDGPDLHLGERKPAHRGSDQPAGEAMILVVRRTAMMMVVRVGAGLIRRMGEGPPAGIVRGAGMAGRPVALEMLLELVERRRDDPRQIEHQEQRRSTSHAL